MARPKGLPKTGGRKPGSANQKTRVIADAAFESGITPLEVMLQIMQRAFSANETEKALDAASKAAPYMHPRLSSVEAKVDVGYSEMSDDELDALIATAAAEAGVTTGPEGEDEAEG